MSNTFQCMEELRIDKYMLIGHTMDLILSLNGSDWKITGWWEKQWVSQRSMELDQVVNSAVQTIPGTVPGAVNRDLLRAGLLPDPNSGLNSIYGEWVNNREWFYDKTFRVDEIDNAEKYLLVFKGLDYHGEIYLNGKKIHCFEGMFLPVEIDVTGYIQHDRDNFLRIVFFKTPEVFGQFGYSNQISILKSRFNYIWDWCPRIIPVGIWDDVYIRAYNRVKIDEMFPKAICKGETDGDINIQLDLDVLAEDEYTVKYEILDCEQHVHHSTETVKLKATGQQMHKTIQLTNIRKWWPTGYGKQQLYQVKVSIFTKEKTVCDVQTKNIGFRNLRFVSNSHSPANARPYSMEINGKTLFVKGINWVPISPFYGCITREQYQNYIHRFVDMNCNMLRVWGGAILEKKDFYDCCDEMGLLVWQEFPQSSSGINNSPPDNPGFLEKLSQVATHFIIEKRHHASHAIWCGGNELMGENHKPLDESHLNLQMLKSLVEKYDQDKYYLPTSASGPAFSASLENMGKQMHHDVHGPWLYLDDPDHYTFFNHDDSLFRSETGTPGIARLKSLNKYKDQYELWPPDSRNPYWVHRGAWWIQLKQLEKLFGKWQDDGSETAKYVQSSRYMQAESLRYSIDAVRRREPESSGFIIWMGNEPFPNNANTSVVEYDGTPKPAYYWIKKSFSRFNVWAAYEKIRYNQGELFKADIMGLDEFGSQDCIHVNAELFDQNGRQMMSKDMRLDHIVKPDQAYLGRVQHLFSFEWTVACKNDQIFMLRISAKKDKAMITSNEYIFTVGENYSFRSLKLLPDAKVSLKPSANHKNEYWILSNESSILAVGVFIYGNDPERFIETSDNYFCLLPNESKIISIIDKNHKPLILDDICMEFYNQKMDSFD